MSATPRPWIAKDKGRIIVDGSTWPNPRVIAECAFDAPPLNAPALAESWDNRDLIVRAVNAFDALLAVAKRINAHYDEDNGSTYCQTCSSADQEPHDADCALARLDRDFPGWREWTS